MTAILSVLSRIPFSWDAVANTAAGALATSTVVGGVAFVANGINNLFKNPEPFDGEIATFHGTKDSCWRDGKIPQPGEEFTVRAPFFFTESAKEAGYYALNTDSPGGEPVCLCVRPVKENAPCVKQNLFGKKFFLERTAVKVEQVIRGKEAIQEFIKASEIKKTTRS